MSNRTAGHIYVIRQLTSRHRYTMHGFGGCAYKIGKSKEFEIRFKALGILMPYPVETVTTIPVSDMSYAERYIHEKLSDVRMNGEWFALNEYHVNWLGHIGYDENCPDILPEYELKQNWYFQLYTATIVRPDDDPYQGYDINDGINQYAHFDDLPTRDW